MTGEELVENLGTIAHSGSKSFVEAIKAAKGNLSEGLIGQFGVGFYSVFMVSDRVDVYTAGGDGKGHHWSCDGSENFEIEDFDKKERGTKIVAKLKKECDEFSQSLARKIHTRKIQRVRGLPNRAQRRENRNPPRDMAEIQVGAQKRGLRRIFQIPHAFRGGAIDCLHFKADAPSSSTRSYIFPPQTPSASASARPSAKSRSTAKRFSSTRAPKGSCPNGALRKGA